MTVIDWLNDDMADEMILQHPEFRESIRRARQQKADGQAIRLAELRAKYAAQDSEAG